MDDAETSTAERRTTQNAPPGWKPFVYPATLPLSSTLTICGETAGDRSPDRNAAADHAARCQSTQLSVADSTAGLGAVRPALQYTISGTERSYGTLNRLVDIVLAEARFSNPILRNPPPNVSYQWTWPARPHVDPLKEAAAGEKRLATRQSSLTAELAERGVSIDTHIATLAREQRKFEAAGLALPAYMLGPAAPEPAAIESEE